MSLIAGVEGILEAKGPDHALVRVGGVTLLIRVPARDLTDLGAAGAMVRLWTHLVVREDDLQLYGFTYEMGLRLFERLLEVNSVGPRLALGVLSVMRPEAVAVAIINGDAASLTQAPGVGRRTAERIVLDLKGKLEEEFGPLVVTAAAGAGGGDREPALQALVALGYTLQEARQAILAERETGLSMEERVRRALQRMGR